MKVPKCPVCGNFPYKLDQYEEEIMSVEVSPNGYIDGYPVSPYDAYYTKVIATCKCGYIWKLRKTISTADFEIGDMDFFNKSYNKRG